LPVKRALFLLNAAFATAIVDLISQVHLPITASERNVWIREKSNSLNNL
jgi:hypothetical protein